MDQFGKLTLRHNIRLHHIDIGRRQTRKNVLVLIKDLHVRVTTGSGEVLRDFQLDPTRDCQTQAKP